MKIALFEPDIPQNTGTIARFCACMDFELHLIEPMGFIWSDSKLRRAGMDYLDKAHIIRHQSWEHFTHYATQQQARLLLATTKGSIAAHHIEFTAQDICIFGSESSGAPDYVHDYVAQRIHLTMHNNMRSFNLAMSVAMISTLYCTYMKSWD